MARRNGDSRCTIYIGNLPRNIDDRELEDEFRKYGKVRDVWIARKPAGFAFIEYYNEDDAQDAVQGSNGKRLLGSYVRVEIKGAGARGPPRRSDNRVLVTNLPYSCNWQDLKSFFRSVAEPGFVNISRGEGIAEFENRDDMDRAIRKLDNADFMGKVVRVKEDVGRRSRSRSRERERRRRTPSRSRSRRRDRERSRSRGRDRERSKSRSRRKNDSPSRSRSPSAERKRSRSKNSFSHSKSRSPVKSPYKSRSRSASP